MCHLSITRRFAHSVCVTHPHSHGSSCTSAGTDKTSKMERFDFFRRVLHLECLIRCNYATAYLTTFGHAVFSGVTITGISEVDSFSIILYGFWPFIAFGKEHYLSPCFVLGTSLTIILALSLLLL